MLPKHLIVTELYEVTQLLYDVDYGTNQAKIAETHYMKSVDPLSLDKGNTLIYLGQTFSFRARSPWDVAQQPGAKPVKRPKIRLYRFLAIQKGTTVWLSQNEVERAVWSVIKKHPYQK